MTWELNKCLCLPLRIGLLIYGYFALVINYLWVLHKLFQLSDYLEGREPIYDVGERFRYIDLSLTFAFLIVHFIFHVTLVAGIHRKSRGLLEVFFGYQMLLAIGEVVIASLYLPLQIYKNYTILRYNISLPVLVGVTFTVLIFLQVYLIVTVRSYITSLEDSSEETYQPASGLEDAECTLQYYNKTKEYCDECL